MMIMFPSSDCGPVVFGLASLLLNSGDLRKFIYFPELSLLIYRYSLEIF